MTALNLHVYPSIMVNESRIDRMSSSLQGTGAFSETHLVGIGGPGLRADEDLHDGRHIRRIAVRVRAQGVVGKVIRGAAWQVAVYRTYRRAEVAVVHAHSVWMLPLCWAIAEASGASLSYNAHELETETPTMKGIKRAAAQAVERLLIRRCALVSVVNQSIAAWYEAERGIPRPLVVRNIPLVGKAPASLRDQIGVPLDALLFIHTGRLTGGRHLEQIADAFRNQGRAHVVFLGDGPLGGLIRAACEASPFVHWLAPVAPDLVVSHVAQADVALCLIELESLSYRLSSPNKLFEALAAGVPPLCTNLTEARRLLGDAAATWIIGDPVRDLPEALERIDRPTIARFKATWMGLPTWDDEIAAYLDACTDLAFGSDKSRTVWILNHHAARPDEALAGSRHFFLGRGLSAHGWQTAIIGGSNLHSTGRQRLGRRQLQSTEQVDGVTFRWLRSMSYGSNGISRVASMVGFALAAVSPYATSGLPCPDAVIGSSVHPLAAWAGLVLARRHRVPFFFEIRDLWPETLIQMGRMGRDGIPAKSMRRLERHLCTNATKVITTMPFADEYLEREGTPRSHVEWISNGVDLRDFTQPARRDEEAAQAEFTFMYFGAFGPANSLDTLISAFAIASRDDGFTGARFRLIGQGPDRPMIEEQTRALGLSAAVSLEDPVPKSEIAGLGAQADVLVVALRPLQLYEYGISLNKLFDYMAAGRPILFAGKARGNPVEDTKGGIVTDCEASAVADAMRALQSTTAEQRWNMGAHNRTLVEDAFSYDALASRLAAILTQAGR